MDIELENGYSASIEITADYDSDAPWCMEDGHGTVSAWRRDGKGPGERVLVADNGACLYYDYAAAIELAKRDRWDAPPYGAGTKGERAVRAVEADYKRLRAWCMGEWQYGVLTVTLFRHDVELESDSLGGVESDGDYWRSEGECMARAMLAGHVGRQRAAWRAALCEKREQHAMACRDIVTA